MLFRSLPISEMVEATNAALLVIPLMETPTAIANAEAIAAVPGVDALLIGTNDLSAEMGLPGEFGHPKIAAAFMQQAQKVTLTSRAMRNNRMGPFLKKLTDLCGFERALPMNTGAEAVETAIKLARRYGYEKKGIPEDRA